MSYNECDQLLRDIDIDSWQQLATKELYLGSQATIYLQFQELSSTYEPLAAIVDAEVRQVKEVSDGLLERDDKFGYKQARTLQALNKIGACLGANTLGVLASPNNPNRTQAELVDTVLREIDPEQAYATAQLACNPALRNGQPIGGRAVADRFLAEHYNELPKMSQWTGEQAKSLYNNAADIAFKLAYNGAQMVYASFGNQVSLETTTENFWI
jgi:hypothetical protein